MEKLLLSNKNAYQNLMAVKANLEVELASITEDICLYFVQVQITKTTSHPVSSTILMLRKHYPDRFIRDNKDKYSKSHLCKGDFKFSYGDFLYDKKRSMNGVVLSERSIYISIWYYEEGCHVDNVKRRNKFDKDLIMILPSVLDEY